MLLSVLTLTFRNISAYHETLQHLSNLVCKASHASHMRLLKNAYAEEEKNTRVNRRVFSTL